jgi:hypothetical protein
VTDAFAATLLATRQPGLSSITSARSGGETLGDDAKVCAVAAQSGRHAAYERVLYGRPTDFRSLPARQRSGNPKSDRLNSACAE